MQWTDEGVILGARRHGEGAVIVEVMTRGHGRHLGLVRGGRSARMGALIQPGNTVDLTWRARLDEHLGQFSVEANDLKAGRFLEQATALHGLAHMAGLIRLLPEREPHGGLYEALLVVLEHLQTAQIAAPLIVRFELALLAELGFGLDLGVCAVTGGTQELVYVSPKSGRAVSRAVGTPYADRLLALPAFVRDGFLGDTISHEEIVAGFALTGHFLMRDVWGPRGLKMPQERHGLLSSMAR